jgi:hypothetical protein
VSEHTDHDTVRIANEEAADAPWFVDRPVDDLVPCPDCFSVRRINSVSRVDVYAHVRKNRLHARRRDHDLRLADPKPM